MKEKEKIEIDSAEEEILESTEIEKLDDEEYEEYEDYIQVQEMEPAVYELETKIGKKDLFSYMIMHTYSTISGKITVCLSLLALLMLLLGGGKGDAVKTGLLLVVAALYTVVNPVLLYLKAVRQAKLNPAYKDIMKFGFHEKGINVAFGEQEGMIGWDTIVKVKKNKKIWALYTTPIQAFLIPVRDLEKNGTVVADYIEEHITK